MVVTVEFVLQGNALFFDVDLLSDAHGIEESLGDVAWLVFVGLVPVVVPELALRLDERDKGSGRGRLSWRAVGLRLPGSE